jgi:hypothetical protein
MLGLIRKSDSFGKTSYFTIVGANESSCFDQLCELSSHAYECETGNEFALIAYRIEGKWFSVDGKEWSNDYVSELLK